MTYVSCKHIVSRVFRNLKPSDANWTLDAVEWIGEALGLIGRGVHMEEKVSFVEVSDFKTSLPEGLLKINQIGWMFEGSTVPVPVYKNESVFVAGDFEQERQGVPTVKQRGHFLHFSKEEGRAVLSYVSLALDEDGWPMVADHPSFSNALFYYIVRCMMDGGYKHPHLNYMQVDEMWLRYCAQARTQAIAPDLMEMEKLRQQWTNILPLERYSTFFDESSSVNDSSYGRIEPSEPINPLDFNL